MKRINLLYSLLVLFNVSILYGQTDLNIPIRGICIYIDYPDAPMNVTPVQLEGMINDMDYHTTEVNRSFRKYWYQETRRNYDIQHDIFYYTAPHPSTYYETLYWQQGIELWKDALEWVISNNPNYNWDLLSKWTVSDPYNDENPDQFAGAVKAVSIISSKWGPAGVGGAHFPVWTLSNGTYIRAIQSSVLQAPWHSTLNLFMFAHETGHSIFNLPDTYDNDASSSGTGKYSVMSAQGPDVEPVGAPFLYQHNWGYIKELEEAGTYTFTLPADGDTIVVIKNRRDPNEFFALEARKNTTPGNSLFPVPLGLLIWHSDLKVHTINTLEDATRYAHYKHSIIQKDGLLELENGGPYAPCNAGDIFVPRDVFNDKTNPNARWWAGEASGIEVKDIVLVDDSHIQFTVVISSIYSGYQDFIPKDNWTLVSATSSMEGFDGSKAFDNDLSTYYHVGGKNINVPRPHELIIDLGATYFVNEFYYTSNKNNSIPSGGKIKDYSLYLSVDGINWGEPIVSEQFFNSDYRQYALFSNQVARYAKFSALNSYGTSNRTSVAEIDFKGIEVNLELKNNPGMDQEPVDQITFSPNPVTNYLSIETIGKDYKVRFYNSIGAMFKEVKVSDTSNRIDMSNFPAGIWMISVYDNQNKHIASERILKLN